MSHPDRLDYDTLRVECQGIRASILRMAYAGRTPHVASALSCADLLGVLYFSVLRVDPEFPGDPDRDRFLLSKGHACMAQYAALAAKGFFPAALLKEYAADGGRLAEHPGPGCVPGIEAATGSLGHGLSLGAGLALAGRLRGAGNRVFVLLSDGECNEGSVWEAAIFAHRYALDNLVAIVDYNKWSAMDRTEAVLEPFAEKWKAFGWATSEIDGHDLPAIRSALSAAPFEAGRPTAIVAHTVKGKGVGFMENNLEWHYRPPREDDLRLALAEIEETIPEACLQV
jgi:transketolase